MKKAIIRAYPHMEASGIWNAAIILLNTGIKKERVEMVYRCGTKTVRIPIDVEPLERLPLSGIFLTEKTGTITQPFALFLVSSEYIMPTVGMYVTDASGIKFWNSFNAISALPLSIASPGEADDMRSCSWSHFYGDPEGAYLRREYASIVRLALAQDSINYNNQFQNSIVLGDCCRSDASDLSGHPSGSHAGCLSPIGGRAMDINYPLFNGGYTQFRPAGVNATSLMTDTGAFNYSLFDHRRFISFLRHLRVYFPELLARVDVRIFNYLYTLYNDVIQYIQSDPEGAYNHDKHCHINLGTNANWEGQ